MKPFKASISQRFRQRDDATIEPLKLDRFEQFHHESLDLSRPTIRVLSVLPGEVGSAIACKLWHIDVVEDGHKCLSYMWGSEEPTNAILINDKLFMVRNNLYDFLKYARKTKLKGPLWIDALSINQKDTAERNHQVGQMAQIYRKAEHVFIYPGPISTSLASSTKEFMRAVYEGDSHAFLSPRRASGLRQAARKLYWERAWIVQEVLLASSASVITGSRTIQWPKAALLAEKIMIEPSPASETMFDLLYYHEESTTTKQPGQSYEFSLEGILSVAVKSKCRDRRDRIYAILGICKHGDRITIDYSEDEVVTVFRVVREYLLRDSPVSVAFGELNDLIYWLSMALRVRYALICGSCFLLLPSARQDMNWPGLDRHDINLINQVVFAGFDDQMEQKDMLRPVRETRANNVIHCQDCGHGYHAAPGSRGQSRAHCSVVANHPTAICVQINNATAHDPPRPVDSPVRLNRYFSD